MENFSDRAGAASRIIRRMSDKPNNTLSHIASLQYLTDLKSLKSLKLTLFDYKWSGPNMSSDQNSKLVSFALHVHQSMLIVHGPQIDYISKFSNKLSKIKKLELELPEALDNLDLANLNESWRFVGQLIVSLQCLTLNLLISFITILLGTKSVKCRLSWISQYA